MLISHKFILNFLRISALLWIKTRWMRDNRRCCYEKPQSHFQVINSATSFTRFIMKSSLDFIRPWSDGVIESDTNLNSFFFSRARKFRLIHFTMCAIAKFNRRWAFVSWVSAQDSWIFFTRNFSFQLLLSAWLVKSYPISSPCVTAGDFRFVGN